MPKNNISMFNCRLVEAVEKHPCLYDYNLKDYCNREITNAVWESIANELNADVQECKNTWKNLRIVFTRYLRNVETDSSKKRKEYYLNTRMMFLCPFVRPKTSTSLANSMSSSSSTTVQQIYNAQVYASWPKNDNWSDNETDNDDDRYICQISEDTCSESSYIAPKVITRAQTITDDILMNQKEAIKIESDYITVTEDKNMQSIEESPKKQRTKKRRMNEHDVNQQVEEFLQSNCKPDDNSYNNYEHNSYRRLFLLSLVPDIEQMNVSQFRKFRLKVDEIIEKILEA